LENDRSFLTLVGISGGVGSEKVAEDVNGVLRADRDGAAVGGVDDRGRCLVKVRDGAAAATFPGFGPGVVVVVEDMLVLIGWELENGSVGSNALVRSMAFPEMNGSLVLGKLKRGDLDAFCSSSLSISAMPL